MFFVSAACVAFTACTDEYEYDKAPVPAGEQAYFDNRISTANYEITADDNTVVIPVSRINRQGEATVPLTVTQAANGEYTVDADAKFADGDSTANVTVTFDPSKMTEGTSYNITLSIGDGYSTPYGNSTYTFSARLSPWVFVTDGTFTYNAGELFTGESDVFEGTDDAALYSNSTDPTEFRIMPYANGDPLVFNMDADGNISFSGVKTGINYSQTVYAGDYNTMTAGTTGTSYYENGTYVFATIYYAGSAILGGSFETFTPASGTPSSAPKAIRKIERKPLSSVGFKSSLKIK